MTVEKFLPKNVENFFRELLGNSLGIFTAFQNLLIFQRNFSGTLLGTFREPLRNFTDYSVVFKELFGLIELTMTSRILTFKTECDLPFPVQLTFLRYSA